MLFAELPGHEPWTASRLGAQRPQAEAVPFYENSYGASGRPPICPLGWGRTIARKQEQPWHVGDSTRTGRLKQRTCRRVGPLPAASRVNGRPVKMSVRAKKDPRPLPKRLMQEYLNS